MRSLRPVLCVATAAGILASGVLAQELRGFQRIRTPRHGAGKSGRVKDPVPRGQVDKAVQDLAKAWSNRELGGLLATSFQQGQRLVEASELRVPRDAIMQVESTRNVFTLSQEERAGEGGGRERVSVVSATVASRLVLNDPQAGFVSVPGENEVLFEVVEELP